MASWSNKVRFRIGLFSVIKINDVKGLLVQMHPRRKNSRIVGWVGILLGCFAVLSYLWQLKLKEERWLKQQASGLHQRSISEFLTPSRRSHPHVEPLLAPYKFLDKKERG